MLFMVVVVVEDKMLWFVQVGDGDGDYSQTSRLRFLCNHMSMAKLG